jgi:hypothetical protein
MALSHARRSLEDEALKFRFPQIYMLSYEKQSSNLFFFKSKIRPVLKNEVQLIQWELGAISYKARGTT